MGLLTPNHPPLVMHAAPGAPGWALSEQVHLVSADRRRIRYSLCVEETS